MIKVTVRWWDGYLESFAVKAVRAGGYLLWLKLENGEERRIPLQQYAVGGIITGLWIAGIVAFAAGKWKIKK